MATSKRQQRMTASQKIEALEHQIENLNNSMQQIFGLAEELAKHLDNNTQTIGAVTRRLNAAIQEGGIDNDGISKILVEENVKELTSRTQQLIDNGIIVLDGDDGVVTPESFVVGRELDSDKNVVQQRLQFAVAGLQPEGQKLVLGKKKGDLVKNEKDGTAMEIQEIYSINKKVEKDVSVENDVDAPEDSPKE